MKKTIAVLFLNEGFTNKNVIIEHFSANNFLIPALYNGGNLENQGWYISK
ncbi:MAG: hypothetical protein Q4G08_10105 [Capnocytophaga sp.]|nr:hypothetical protein [Capnocytophaga sp.]